MNRCHGVTWLGLHVTFMLYPVKLKCILKTPNISGYKNYKLNSNLLVIYHFVLITRHGKRVNTFARLKGITKCLIKSKHFS